MKHILHHKKLDGRRHDDDNGHQDNGDRRRIDDIHDIHDIHDVFV